MLLTNRRHRVLFLALAAMESAGFAPFVVLIVRYWWQRLDLALLRERGLDALADTLAHVQTVPPIALFLGLFGTMVVYMLVADLLNRSQVETPVRELIIVALVVGTSLLSVRLLLYTQASVFDFRWLRETLGAVFNFTSGRRPEVIILLLNGLIWWRVAAGTDRDLSFFAVGVNFRLGLLLSVIGNALLVSSGRTTPGDAFTFFALFMMAGLTAVSVARIDEKALLTEHSRGAVLPWIQVVQITGAALVTLLLGGLLALLYRPATLLRVLGWFAPVWRLLEVLVTAFLYAVVWMLAPVMNAAIRFFQWLAEKIDPIEPPQQEQAFGEIIIVRPTDITGLLERHDNVRYVLVALMILAAFALIWLFFVRSRRRMLVDEEEAWVAEQVTFGGGILGRGVDRLRDLLDLVRRYGLGTQLLAAISIHNIYANTTRMARMRGFPRPTAQPPDLYLPTLRAAFPGCEAELARITEAYMRVEYGDQALDEVELDQVRAGYRLVRNVPPPDKQPRAEGGAPETAG